MEERNLELDDDGKIKIKRNTQVLPEESEETGSVNDIVINLPDFKGFGEENEGGAISDEELVRRSKQREQERLDRRERAEKELQAADALFEQGDLDGAGEKYLDSASLYGGDWRPWFGVVRVQTKDLTDFSAVYDCEQAYDKAFHRMTAEDRLALAEKYVPSLRERAEFCAAESERLGKEDERVREEERPFVLRELKRTAAIFACCLFFFIAALTAGSVLAGQIFNYAGNTFLILTIAFFVAALGIFVAVVAYGKRLVHAKVAKNKNLRAGTSLAGEQGRVYAEEEELILSIIEDLTK